MIDNIGQNQELSGKSERAVVPTHVSWTIIGLILAMVGVQCKAPQQYGQVVVLADENIEVVRDPYEHADFVAVIKVTHDALEPQEVLEYHVDIESPGEGRPGLYEILYPKSTEFQTNFDMSDILATGQVGIPVLGLYPDAVHTVSFEIVTQSRSFTGEAVISTPTMPEKWDGKVTIHEHEPAAMEPGWTSINDAVFDHNGHLRWFGPGIHLILENGNFMDRTMVNERNFLGKHVSNRFALIPDDLIPHHNSIELPSGNIMVCVNNDLTDVLTGWGKEMLSLEDYIIELDKDSSEIVNAWDMRAFFDVDRYTLMTDGMDWFHMNDVAYDESDDSIIVSGRYQGVAKISRGGVQGAVANQEKELQWILAPHLDYGMSGWDGNGDIDPNQYLLTAVDLKGEAYDEDVQKNLAPPPEDRDDFHWPLGQHSLNITYRQGDIVTLLTFSNQASVIFDGEGSVDNLVYGDTSNDRSLEPYSLVVAYEINEAERTVKQPWAQGQDMPELFCYYRSGVMLMESTANALAYSCGAELNNLENNPFNPHVIEWSSDGDIVFHMEITGPETGLYRSRRLNLFHPDQSAN